MFSFPLTSNSHWAYIVFEWFLQSVKSPPHLRAVPHKPLSIVLDYHKLFWWYFYWYVLLFYYLVPCFKALFINLCNDPTSKVSPNFLLSMRSSPYSVHCFCENHIVEYHECPCHLSGEVGMYTAAKPSRYWPQNSFQLSSFPPSPMYPN